MTDQELLSLSEEDIKLRLNTPAIVEKAGWSKENIRMEFPLTDGRVIILGKSHGVQQPKRLDYLLRLNAHQMIAVVEAKSARKDLTTGIQQAIEYAVALHLPFAYASNGKAFLEHDMLTGAERQFSMDEFPTSEQLKQRAIREKNLTPEQAEVMETPYYFTNHATTSVMLSTSRWRLWLRDRTASCSLWLPERAKPILPSRLSGVCEQPVSRSACSIWQTAIY